MRFKSKFVNTPPKYTFPKEFTTVFSSYKNPYSLLLNSVTYITDLAVYLINSNRDFIAREELYNKTHTFQFIADELY